MAKKVPLFFVAALSFGCLLFLTEAKPLDKKNPASISIAIDLKDPLTLDFELSLLDKISLNGRCDSRNNSLKVKALLQDFDLSSLGQHMALPLGGYIKKGDIDLAAGKTYSLKGELEIRKLNLNRKDLNLKGNIKLSGYLNLPQQGLDYHINYQIKDGYFSKLTSVSAIQVKGFLKKDELCLNQGGLIYKNTPFGIAGRLEDFSSPKIALTITNNLWNLKAEAQRKGKILEISNFLIEGKDTKIKTQAKIDIEGPRANVRGEGRLNLADIVATLDSFGLKSPCLSKLNPQGHLEVSFALSKNNLQEKGQITLSGTSSELEIQKSQVTDLKFDLVKEGNKLTFVSLANLSGGAIDLQALLNTSNKKGSLYLTANNIDISQAMHELNLKGQESSGKLSLQVHLKNLDFFQWRELNGEGKIVISEGNIWQINFLKGLGKFLSIPGFDQLVFKKAYSDLFFRGEDIVFENFQLNATQMNIEGSGKITSQGRLDFLLLPKFSQELIDSSKGLQKYLTTLLGGGNLSIEVKGTLKNPRYNIKVSLIPALEDFDKVKDIFKDFLK
ncbi:MAG: hypothetical protein ABIE75_02720 [Candidatus Omnitrophota bacterium]